jgi:CheY-like chemotaxis protein
LKHDYNISSVLLVDDNPATNNFNQLLLKKFGFCNDIKIVENGKKAIDYLNDLDEGNYPNVIFLDLNMPVMNGKEFLELLEEMICVHTHDIKIILLSTSTNLNDLTLAQTFKSVVSYVKKPLNKESIANIWSQLKAS